MRVTFTLPCPGIASPIAGSRATEDVEGRDAERQTEGLEDLQQWIKDERERPEYLEDITYFRTCLTLYNNP